MCHQHPDWINNGNLGFPNDIAVLELASDANIAANPYIEAIALPEAGRTPDDWIDQSCVISGWGRLNGMTTPVTLKNFARSFLLFDHDNCNYMSIRCKSYILSSQVAASFQICFRKLRSP